MWVLYSCQVESRCLNVGICHLNNCLLMLQIVSLQRRFFHEDKTSRVLSAPVKSVRLLPPAAPPCAKSLPRGGISSHWGTLSHWTRQSLHHGGAFRVPGPAAESPASLRCNIRRGSYPPTEPLYRPAARPHPPPCCQPLSHCQVCCSGIQCRFCYNHLVWEQGVTRPAPSESSSVLFGKKRLQRQSVRPLPPLFSID